LAAIKKAEEAAAAKKKAEEAAAAKKKAEEAEAARIAALPKKNEVGWSCKRGADG